jgi:hypothetical protein
LAISCFAMFIPAVSCVDAMNSIKVCSFHMLDFGSISYCGLLSIIKV